MLHDASIYAIKYVFNYIPKDAKSQEARKRKAPASFLAGA
jgi:hypothetical protein